MSRRIILTLAIAWSVPVFGQATAGNPVTPEPPSSPAPLTTTPPVAPETATPSVPPAQGSASGQVPMNVQARPMGGGPYNDPPEILVAPEGPNIDRGESNRVRLPPAGPGREAFLQEFLRVDPRANLTFRGPRELSASEFYGTVGRPDLVAASNGQTQKRIWLMAAATLITAGGVAAGVVVLGNAQNLNDPACFANGLVSYNNCVDRSKETTLIGGLIIAGAVAVGGGILTWALTTPEMVTAPEETVRLAKDYNQTLSVRHGAPAGAQLEILPSIGPQGASLSARVTF